MLSPYGQPFAVPSFGAGEIAQGLQRLPFSRARTPNQDYNEAWLQSLIARHPELLPIEMLEPSLHGAKSICTEMATPAGYIDNLFATDRGDLILVECKLWRNPQARREVVGQIIDYAKELASWDYERLDAAVRRSTPAPGISKDRGLFERASSPDGLDEVSFIDAASRNLRRGRFLLMIVGDGIQEGVHSMAEFLQQHAALHFTLGIVELALFSGPNGAGYIIQPRILARTTLIERGIVELKDDRLAARLAPVTPPPHTAGGRPLAMPRTITDELFLEELDAREPGMAAKFQTLLAQLSELAVTTEALQTSMKLVARVDDASMPLGTIVAKDGSVWFEAVTSKAATLNRRDAALRYYQSLARLIQDPQLRSAKLNPSSKSGTASLPLNQLLRDPKAWSDAIATLLAALADR